MRRRTNGNTRGFSLVEVLLSLVVLALAASIMSSLYVSGMQTLAAQDRRVLLDSALSSRMELLLSTKFASMNTGTGTVTVGGQDYTIAWDVTLVDLDGDSVPEASAKQVIVTLDGRSLTTIVVDNGGAVGKL
ncbi:MAG: prepilin-type N-terminal cleavage/methylation domain-containing protein [Planctomycetes bacterium]|nr:prepilin-type N-terminal cleavage/methylation domain-containing protein [Planctomycetota bacterium]